MRACLLILSASYNQRGSGAWCEYLPVETMASTIDVARRRGDGKSNGYLLLLLSVVPVRLAAAASTMARSAGPNFSFSKIRSVAVSAVGFSVSDDDDSFASVARITTNTGLELFLRAVVFLNIRQRHLVLEEEEEDVGGKPACES